jgi:FlaA1/EpsC-like NDP-sugar epimerase
VPSVSRKRRNEILSLIRTTSVRVQTLPALLDLAQGRVTVNDLRDLDIEDLLGRDSVAPNDMLLAQKITGKTILVTGAGGSIGSELCRQILLQKPKSLLLVDISEFALYSIHQELQQRLGAKEGCGTRLIPLLASVLDVARMDHVMQTWQPDTVYHAAAYKHVPLVEHNPAEGARNNIIGTLTAARAARDNGVSDFVLISTDKAVRPTNTMGTTKRCAEMVLQAFAAQGSGTGTCFSMVRFGNVLGSSGSVVPLFRKQIREGGPITITHQDVIRYFMTIPEAAQLVIQAGAMAKGGEVFVLDMGEPVRIIDLARNMIALSGLSVIDEDNPDGDIAIETVGLRPGEKLYEELLIGENPVPTSHPKIMKANEEYLPWSELDGHLQKLIKVTEANDAVAIRELLLDIVPGFSPTDDVVDFVFLEKHQSLAGQTV